VLLGQMAAAREIVEREAAIRSHRADRDRHWNAELYMPPRPRLPAPCTCTEPEPPRRRIGFASWGHA
jgi:hypothetical protein